MKKRTYLAALSLLALSTSALAGGIETAPLPMDASGFFLGLGGSYNSAYFNQFIAGTGTSDVTLDGVVVARGAAAGITFPARNVVSTFAPQAQLGYFGHFSGSDYLWGAKLEYQYLGATVSQGPIDSPQSGVFTTIVGSDTFTGNAVIRTAQTNINNQWMLFGFVGHSFGNKFVYLGVGPALFSTVSKLYNLTGYADINGTRSDLSGSSVNFSNNKWVWAGAAQIGATYYLNPTWFVDLNYTCAFSENYLIRNSAPFTTQSITAGHTLITTGTMNVSTRRHFTVQTLGFSINKILF